MTEAIVERVIVPVGGTDREFFAQEHAAQMAQALGASVHAVHVRPDPDAAPAEVFQHIAEVAKRHGVSFEGRVLAGDDVAAELIAEAGPQDLVILGTRRIQGGAHVGSIAVEVLRGAEGPVQVVRLPA